ncbi:MAG: DUF6883 domain-containing protein [Gemmatimonadales bacterium]
MRIPNYERAYIDPRKVRDYLLSPVHPVGRLKAVFFRVGGYSRGDWTRLYADLLATAKGEARLGRRSPFGQRYEVGAILPGPAGISLRVTVIWQVDGYGAYPRLLTVIPEVAE